MRRVSRCPDGLASGNSNPNWSAGTSDDEDLSAKEEVYTARARTSVPPQTRAVGSLSGPLMEVADNPEVYRRWLLRRSG
jgi:hypothetical protein